jgi:hypothetical protein
MRRIKELRPSPAMAVAFVALFVAGAGGATAAKGLITGKQVKNNSITGKDVKNGSLLKKDFKRGQLPRGAQGPQGPQGLAGPAGRAGRDGFGMLTYAYAESVPLTVGLSGTLSAECPSGTYPTGGDVGVVENTVDFDPVPAHEVVVFQGYSAGADGRPDGWFALVDNQSEVETIAFVDAICANASPAPAPVTVAKRAKVSPQGRDLAK